LSCETGGFRAFSQFRARKLAWLCASFVVTAAIPCVALAEGAKTVLPPGWISELPTVDRVRALIPPGNDERETAIRQSAAFEVLEDFIKAVTGKGVGELTRMPAEAESRFREYDRADTFAPKAPVWKLAGTREFRVEVLAKTVSPASQQAYWSVRSAIMDAQETRRVAAASTNATISSVPDQLPSVATIVRDMKGSSDRDTAARIEASLQSLAHISEQLRGGWPKSVEYARERDKYRDRYSDRCKDEPGCDVSVAGRFSRFYWCRSAYEGSPGFLRAILDRYIPPSGQAEVESVLGVGGEQWRQAFALPSHKDAVVPPPTLACTTEGQFVGEGALSKQLADAAARTHALRRARAVNDAAAKALALADAQRAKGNVDTTVFGVPLGSVSTLPDCEVVGHREKNTLDVLFGSNALPTTLVSSKTCLSLEDDGTTSIHWGDGALPSWAETVHTEFKDDVLVAVTIEFLAVPRRSSPLNTGLGPVAQMQFDQAYYESASKRGLQNVEKAHKALFAKYGPLKGVPKRSYKNEHGVVTRVVDEPEWGGHGVHVKYSSGPYDDSVVIELESVETARADDERQKEAAEPKL
jgi:hypothetical protein